MELAGKPLVAWSIEAVASAQSAIRCIVSTDDEEIATVAREWGAEVIVRPPSLATDDSPTEPSLIHTLDSLLREEAYAPSEVLLLQPTSPVRQVGTVDNALKLFRELDVDSVVSVVAVSPFLWRGPLNDPTPLYDPNDRPRRQDIGQDGHVFRENGSIYVMKSEGLRRHQNRISGRVATYLMDEFEAVDIDTYGDVEFAEMLLGRLVASSGNALRE